MKSFLALALAISLVLPGSVRPAHGAIGAASGGALAVIVVGALFTLVSAATAATGAVFTTDSGQPSSFGSALLISGIFGIVIGILILPADPQVQVPTFLELTPEGASRLSSEQRAAFENERAELNVTSESVVLEVAAAHPESREEARALALRAWEEKLPQFSPEFREAFRALVAQQ